MAVSVISTTLAGAGSESFDDLATSHLDRAAGLAYS